MSAAAATRGAPEMVAIEHETRDRVARTIVFALPPAALVAGAWLAWGGALHWSGILVLAICYVLTGLGITVGYHRLFTHRSFKTSRAMRVLLAMLGSMAVEGPVLEWVATHRKHHRFTDVPGDPHSPHLDDTPGWRGATEKIPECQPHLKRGEHLKLYRFSPEDYQELAAVFNGPHPETGEDLVIAEQTSPEEAPAHDLPPQPAVFSPGPEPEEITEIAAKLRKAAGLPSKPTGIVAKNGAGGSSAAKKVKAAAKR